MKFYVSYFYAVRFMKPNTIALSTAVSDPQWFHKGWDKKVQYWDKNGVLNGLRAEPFVPDIHGGDFLAEYKKQLDNLDFDDMMNRFEKIAASVYQGEEEPEIVLLVHEAPDNPHSERWALFDWFAGHGVHAKEYPIPKTVSKRAKRQTYDF